MRVYPGIAVLLLAKVAVSAPVAHVEADIDGDGTRDRVTVEANGELAIDGTKHATFTLLPGLIRAAISTAEVRNVRTILVVGASGAQELSVVLVYRGGSWQELLRERTGPADADSDYAIALGINATGVYRYQIRTGLRRCDGKPSYLFAEGWDGQRFRRLSKIPTWVPETTPAIPARLDPTDSPAPLIYQARAASHQPSAADAGALAPPTELTDAKADTFWREEFAGSGGEGQFFTFEPLVAEARARRIRIVPAISKAPSPRVFNRPRRIAIVGASGAWRIELPDAATVPGTAAYVADIPVPIEGCVTVILESTYGPANGTTAIAELGVFSEGEPGGGEAMLARAVAAGANGANRASRALAQRGATAAAAIEQQLRLEKDVQAKRRLAHALIAINDRNSGPLIARAIANGSVHEIDLRDATAALAAMGLTEELQELVSRDDVAIEARVHALGALAKIPEFVRCNSSAGNATQPLGNKGICDVVGVGPPELRRRVVEVASAMPAATLLAAVRATNRPTAAADLWRSAIHRASASESERPAVIAAMVTGLATARDYEVQSRLVAGIAALGDRNALRSLQEFFRQGSNPATRAAFEQVAARAMEQHRHSDSEELLLWLLRESDPGVRAAALGALRIEPHDKLPHRVGVTSAIETALASDTWPEVRARAAQALGTFCARPQQAHALITSFGRDPEASVREAAITALVQCKAAGTGPFLVRAWSDNALPIALRIKAIELAVEYADAATTMRLIRAFDEWQRAAIESSTVAALAQAGAYAIGRLAAPEAEATLERALRDDSLPEIVAAAALGLGAMGPKCHASTRSRLKSLARSGDPQIRVAAGRAALQCGTPP